MFSNVALKKLHTEITPRFDDMNLKAGFTRIEKIGRRKPDSAEMAMIELVGNPLQRWEKAQEQDEAQELGRPTFWQWEHKILRQEQQYFKNLLDGV